LKASGAPLGQAATIYRQWAWPAVIVLMVGLTFHNLLVVLLVDTHLPLAGVKLLSAWKDLILALLVVGGLLVGRRRRALTLLDWLMVAYVMLNLAYALGGHGPLAQRLLGLRQNSIFAIAYGAGRFLPMDMRLARTALIALVLTVTAAAALGIFEVMLIPTRAWVDWGLPQYTHSLGFYYSAPFGLPENLFINIGGILVRRAISIYLSPLALGFAILLVAPVVVWLMARQRQGISLCWGAALLLLLGGLALTITRAAVLMAIPVMLAAAMRVGHRRILIPFTGMLSVLLLVFMFTPISASVTPRVDLDLNPVRVPATRGAGSLLLSGRDDSLREHMALQLANLRFITGHPLGVGIGRVGGVGVRTGEAEPAGEDTYLQLGAELGWAGLALVVVLHGAALLGLVRKRASLVEDPLAGYWLLAVIGGVAIFILQIESDILGDFPVVVPLWIAIGWLLSPDTRTVPANSG
jgi:hypothetical protein